LWLIAGLGNPGREYASSRHNVGFLILDELARRVGRRVSRRRADALAAEVGLGSSPVTLIKPLAFMNESGGPVKAWLNVTGVLPDRLVVIHDDLDLDFGRVKVVARGGHGGHRGVRAIQDAIGTREFPRVRVGIGRPDRGDEVAFVLAPFDEADAGRLPDVVSRAADAVEEIVARGVSSAMNRFNIRRRLSARGEPAEPTRGEVKACPSTR
jgi:peptidyl-tRNA hydrolase, PTH1 family